MAINRTISGIETRMLKPFRNLPGPINRTISGIETEQPQFNRFASVQLSIAPSLELKQTNTGTDTTRAVPINRTISGIETSFSAVMFCTCPPYQSHHLWN